MSLILLGRWTHLAECYIPRPSKCCEQFWPQEIQQATSLTNHCQLWMAICWNPSTSSGVVFWIQYPWPISANPRLIMGLQLKKKGKGNKKTALLGLMPNLVKGDSLMMAWQLSWKQGNSKTVLGSARCRNSLNKNRPCLTLWSAEVTVTTITFCAIVKCNRRGDIRVKCLLTCTGPTSCEHLVDCLITESIQIQIDCYVSVLGGGSSFNPLVSRS